MPQISVIMGVYNETNKDVIMKAVMSILNQTFTDFELIIYNDGSCNNTTNILEEIDKLDDRIKIIGKEENHGLAFSLNECIKHSKGDFIARMDADDYSFPERLRLQKKYLDSHPDISWCGSNTLLFNENGVWGERVYPEFPDNKDFLKYSPFVHPSVMYRKEVFTSSVGYNESEETLRCEDYEIFMRLYKEGLKGANVQKFLFSYREDNDSYDKRTWETRVQEMKLRKRNFKELGIMFPRGWLFIIRPLVGYFVPRRMFGRYKKIKVKTLKR